jgi:single-stranded-DNA-specific exonuclease
MPDSTDIAVGLAALGTIADMMPLNDENRVIVRRGLSRIADLPGLRALCEVAGVGAQLHAADVAFGVAPRINAAGRMEDAKLALQLCLCDDAQEAEALAHDLDAQNRLRQQAVAGALLDAERQVAELDDDLPAIVLGDPGWPMGIVGLVAGRLVERYARPAFIVCLDAGEAKGSARSVSGVHMVRALDRAAASLLRYGGHAAAAGFSLEASRFDEFRALVSGAVREQLNGAPRERVFAIDCEIVTADTTPELCRVLAQLEPCGMGVPQPLLAVSGATVLGTSPFGAEAQHLRVVLAGATGVLEAVAFHRIAFGRGSAICARNKLLLHSPSSDSFESARFDALHLTSVRLATILGSVG